jgi:uncharacterized protein (UPF0548 family)
MFSFRRPTDAAIRSFLAEQVSLPFNYAEVGATATGCPASYTVDRSSVLLGDGDEAYRRAVAAIRSWRQFDLGWVAAVPNNVPIRPGEVVAIRAWALGMWALSAARIVYVVDEPTRFGFAYGTLPGHVEVGEERFLVEQLADGSVWYDIVAFSRPGHLLTKLGYPLVRRLQKRFGRESAAAMQRAGDGSR